MDAYPRQRPDTLLTGLVTLNPLRLGLLLFCLIFVWFFGHSSAWAGLRIDITKGGLQPLPIAIPPFVHLANDGRLLNTHENQGQRISDIVTNDLKNSGLFRILSQKSFLQQADDLWKSAPRFRDWRIIGSEALVSGAVRLQNNQLTVDFYLHDVYQETLIGKGRRFSAPLQNWRHVAHRVADEIYTRLTGESGYFTSRISFIAQKGQQKWLSIMDQDGANRIDLTHGKHLVLTPRFSPDGEQLFYLSYKTGAPRIYRWDLYTGKQTIQGNYPGLNSAPSWSPDGTRMALTLSKDGNPEIYLKHLRSGQLTRMTKQKTIDTSPSWSPDGQKIVFNSDRAGTPQLYIMDTKKGQPKRITFDGPYNAAPSWSPRGDLIAYVKGGQGRFRIAVISPDGNYKKTLTNSWMDESPTWSPNGRVILFSRQEKKTNKSRLYTIDLTGHNERLVPVGGNMDGSDPSWSPLIR